MHLQTVFFLRLLRLGNLLDALKIWLFIDTEFMEHSFLQGLALIAKGGKVVCPRTKEEFSISVIEKLFIVC